MTWQGGKCSKGSLNFMHQLQQMCWMQEAGQRGWKAEVVGGLGVRVLQVTEGTQAQQLSLTQPPR